MRRNILLITFASFAWINLYASSIFNDSIKLESIQKEMVECMSFLNNRTDYNSNSYLRTTIKAANRLNELANKYYAITSDSSVFVCSFIGEVITAIVYKSHEQIDSAYVHSQRAFQLFEPYGRMICSSDSTKQWPIVVFGDDGICSIMRDWNVKQEEYEEAIRYGTIIIDSCKAINADLEVIKSLLKQGEIYEEIGNYKKSLELQAEALDKRLAYSNFGKFPFASQIYVGIVNTLERLAEKEKLSVNKKSIEWMYSDTDFFSFLNDFWQSHPLDFCEEEEKNGGIFWVKELFYSFIRLGEKYNNFNAILPLEDGFGEFIIRNYGRESTEFAEYLKEYSSLYNKYVNVLDSDVEKEKYRSLAVEKENLALEIWETFFEKNPIDSLISNYHDILKEYALQNIKEKVTAEEENRLYGILSSYSEYMTHLFQYSFKKNNYDIAYDAVSKAINIEENVLKSKDNASLYNMLGHVSVMRNDLINAEKFFSKSYSLAFENKDTLDMAEANLWLFKLYSLNNQSKARQKLSEAYKLVTGYSYHSIKKSEILAEMADFYNSIYNNIIAYRLICLSQIEKQHCGQTLTDEDYLKEADYTTWGELVTDSVLLSHICLIADKEVLSQKVQKASEILGATFAAGLIDLEKAIHYYQKAAYIAHELKDNTSEAKNTAEIGTILFLKKKYDEALVYMQKAEKINPRLKYRELLTLMAHVHNDSIVGIRLPFLYESTTKELKKKMLTTNAEGREMMVKLMPYEVLKSMTYYYPQLPICADVAYNSTLLYKGLLLNTQKTISEYIASSNDSYLKEQYNKLQIARSKKGQENSKFEESTQSQIETSELEMTILESLSKKKVLSDLEITWNKVRDKLSKNDVAIEFVEINNLEPLDRSAFCYAALILRKGYKHPVFVKLGSKKDIDNYIDVLLNSFNSGSRFTVSKWNTVSGNLYKKLWGQLADYIHSGDNVYFSAAGKLHQAPMEVLNDSNGVLANEKFNLYRVSSTRELCKKEKRSLKSVTLYGGLRYDSKEESQQDRTNCDVICTQSDSTNRAGWDFLPSTLVEIKQIASKLDSLYIPSAIYDEEKGTEESFRNLSGKDISILHIATHGFFFNEKELYMQDYYTNSFQNVNYISPMKRTGLMMSGGQSAWLGTKKFDQKNDGVLLADEIASLDLSHTNLVVLSACQTGLGDIDEGGEGVFGIQRALKLAGVNSIIMTLGKVDDKATRLFMNCFYSKLFANNDINRAFLDAQYFVRNYEYEVNGVKMNYKNPRFWAPFILLDAIN